MLYFDILVSCQPQLQTPFLRLEGVLLRQLPLYFISFQLNHSLSLVFWSVNDQSRCVWLDMSYLLHFVLNQTNKKWRLQDWSGKALERDSRYLIHQVRTRYFKIFLISNLCLQNTILGQWLDVNDFVNVKSHAREKPLLARNWVGCCPWKLQQGLMNFKPWNFQLYNKSLKDWSLGKPLMLFPENLSVSRSGCFPRILSRLLFFCLKKIDDGHQGFSLSNLSCLSMLWISLWVFLNYI